MGVSWRGWRRRKRREYIAAREALSDVQRKSFNESIRQHLEAGFSAFEGASIAFCWPFRGEPEPRFAVHRWREAGAKAGLPVVVAAQTPLKFRQWWPGVAMASGVYGIPYPVDSPEFAPTAALVPVVGFDAQGYRLGYGGGYFDRTLASLEEMPVTVGLGYELQRLSTIHPRPHDIPFDFVVTEVGVYARSEGSLQPLDPARIDDHVRMLQHDRGFV